MVQIETVLGYGFHVPREQARVIENKMDRYCLKPMCHTCGQSPYFFGLELQRINSRKAYIEFGLSDIVVKDLNGDITRSLNEEYEKVFGRKPPFEPKFIMFTDIR